MFFKKLRNLLFLCFSTLIIVACSSSNSSNVPDAPRDETAPTVKEIYPESEADGIEVDDVVTVTFSELMDEDSLLNGGIQLFSGVDKEQDEQFIEERSFSLSFEDVPELGVDLVTEETIDIEATELTLAPESGRFSLGNTYTVKVFPLARDRADDPDCLELDDPDYDPDCRTLVEDEANYLGSESSTFFTIEDGEWESAVAMNATAIPTGGIAPEILTEDTFSPHLASNQYGMNVSAWLQSESASPEIKRVWASRFLSSTESWTRLEDSTTGSVTADVLDHGQSSAFAPSVTVSVDGDAAVAWHQADIGESNHSIWVRQFVDGAWSDADNLTPDLAVTDKAEFAEIAYASNGDLIVVWRELTGGVHRVKARRYDVTVDEVSGLPLGWQATQTLSDETLTSDAYSPIIESASKGQTFVAWVQQTSSHIALHVARYVEASGWIAAVGLDKTDEGNVEKVDLAVDAKGDAIVAWQQNDGVRSSIWSARFAAGVWGAPLLMETDNTRPATDPVIAMSSNGQALLLWLQGRTGIQELRSRTFSNNWQEAEVLSEVSAKSNVMVKFDSEGNAVASWLNGTGTGLLSYERYRRIGGWQGEGSIVMPNGVAYQPSLGSLEADGRMLLLWSHILDGDYSLYSSLFTD